MYRVLFRTNLNLQGERWPERLMSPPAVGHTVPSLTRWCQSENHSIRVELKIVAITHEPTDSGMLPMCELHLPDHFKSVRHFEVWYDKIRNPSIPHEAYSKRMNEALVAANFGRPLVHNPSLVDDFARAAKALRTQFLPEVLDGGQAFAIRGLLSILEKYEAQENWFPVLIREGDRTRVVDRVSGFPTASPFEILKVNYHEVV